MNKWSWNSGEHLWCSEGQEVRGSGGQKVRRSERGHKKTKASPGDGDTRVCVLSDRRHRCHQASRQGPKVETTTLKTTEEIINKQTSQVLEQNHDRNEILTNTVTLNEWRSAKQCRSSAQLVLSGDFTGGTGAPPVGTHRAQRKVIKHFWLTFLMLNENTANPESFTLIVNKFECRCVRTLWAWAGI